MGSSSFLISNREKRSSTLGSSDMGSACEVEGIEDILIAILVLLPAASIFRFRCVSKRWNTIIKTPFFLQAYYSFKKARAPQMVFYIRETYEETCTENFYRRNPESVMVCQLPHGPRIIRKSIRIGSDFVNSSGGLVLLKIGRNEYLVFNPLTDRRVRLTQSLPDEFYRHPAVALVCEENLNELVPCYKVVIIGEENETSDLIIQIFCSKTGEWTTSTPIITGALNDILKRYSSNPLVVDGIIHWFTRRRLYLVVFDLKASTSSSLGSNSSTSTIQLVELPRECHKNYCLKVVRSSRDDDLWLCMHMPESCYIKIWMMRRDEYDSYRVRSTNVPCNAWNLIHEISYSAPVPAPTYGEAEDEKEDETEDETDETTHRKWAYDLQSSGPYPCKVPYLAFLPETKRVLRIWNLVNMSFELVPTCWIPNCFARSRRDYTPCMEALSLSSYAL